MAWLPRPGAGLTVAGERSRDRPSLANVRRAVRSAASAVAHPSVMVRQASRTVCSSGRFQRGGGAGAVRARTANRPSRGDHGHPDQLVNGEQCPQLLLGPGPVAGGGAPTRRAGCGAARGRLPRFPRARGRARSARPSVATVAGQRGDEPVMISGADRRCRNSRTPVASNACRISMISLSDFLTAPPGRWLVCHQSHRANSRRDPAAGPVTVVSCKGRSSLSGRDPHVRVSIAVRNSRWFRSTRNRRTDSRLNC